VKVEKLGNGNTRVELQPSELHVVQFLATFFLTIPRRFTQSAVFTGRFVRRVRRIHDALEEVH
jgi:hypothetical protein